MVVQIDVHMLLVESVDGRGISLRDMPVPHVFAYYAPVFPLHQSVVIAMPGPGLGLINQQFIEQPDHHFVNVFRSVVRMKSVNAEWELGQS